MPRLDDSTDALFTAGERAADYTKSKFLGFFDGFTDFALRDNVLEVAVGLIIATSFTKIVNSLVSDVLLPPISLLPGLGKNLDEKFAVLRYGENWQQGYNTTAQARSDGAVVMAYGFFLDQTLNFGGVVLSLFFIARTYQYFSKDTVIKKTVRCKYCRKWISSKATRCLNCTSWQDGSEERRNQ